MLITNSRKQTNMAKILDTKCTLTQQQHPQHTKIHTVVVPLVAAVSYVPLVAAVSYVPLVAATATTASCSIKWWWSYQNMSPRSKL
jgi:hypothetical protein